MLMQVSLCQFVDVRSTVNALGNGRELTGRNGEVEQTVLVAHPLLHAPFDVQLALRALVLIQFRVQFGEILVGIVLARVVVANLEEAVHAARILRQSLSQLLAEGRRIHLRSRIANNGCVHREKRVREQRKQRGVGLVIIPVAHSTPLT